MIKHETEKGFQKAVIDLAHLNGWRVAHFRKARTKTGWVTAVAADGKGFVDLTMVRERVVFAELKRDDGVLTEDQKAWAKALVDGRAEYYIWRPSDWSSIEIVLKGEDREILSWHAQARMAEPGGV